MSTTWVPIGGTVFTTVSQTRPDGVTIVTRSDVQSVVVPLGAVELHQEQAVVPTSLQVAGPVPAAGRLSVEDGVLTGLDGVSTLHYRCLDVPFTVDGEITEHGGLHPITFAGNLIVTGGTGQLAGATGTLHFTGRYSFADNAGYFALAGAVHVAVHLPAAAEVAIP